MADEFQTIPFEVEPNELAQDGFDYLAEQIPGWEPTPGDLLTVAIESQAFLLGELLELAADVPLAVFRHLGANLHHIAPVDASFASAASTWTMVDDTGYTIPEGTQVAIPTPEGDRIGFETAAEVAVPAGSTTTDAGEVLLRAIEEGSAASGLSGTPEPIDGLTYVESIALVGATSGGVDAESDSEYLDRLSEELELLAPRPILSRDFAVLAKRVQGVERAADLDGYNPATQTYGNERMVTVAVVDASGEPVSSLVKDAVEDLLDVRREVNFVVHVIDPTYTIIDVSVTAVSWPGYDPADVAAQAEGVIADYLDPNNWGQPLTAEARVWHNDTTVRQLELAEVINRVEGLHYIDTLIFGVQGNPLRTVDVVLSGAAPLPRAGTVSATVTAP